MSFTKKFAALGAAAAISATGLVAATGTSAHAAATSVDYNCDLSAFSAFLGGAPTTQKITANFDAISWGTAVAGKSVSKPATATITVSPTIAGLIQVAGGGKIAGTVSGTGKVGSQNVPVKMTIPSTAVDATNPAPVPMSGTFGAFTPSTAGAQAVSLPATVVTTLTTSIGPAEVACTAVPGSVLSFGTLTVTKGDSAALTAAKAQLAKDKAALAKAKKALKKAKGHKKVVLKKKVAKLVKKVKADQAKVNSLS